LLSIAVIDVVPPELKPLLVSHPSETPCQHFPVLCAQHERARPLESGSALRRVRWHKPTALPISDKPVDLVGNPKDFCRNLVNNLAYVLEVGPQPVLNINAMEIVEVGINVSETCALPASAS
jgi:hypothetical protein